MECLVLAILKPLFLHVQSRQHLLLFQISKLELFLAIDLIVKLFVLVCLYILSMVEFQVLSETCIFVLIFQLLLLKRLFETILLI